MNHMKITKTKHQALRLVQNVKHLRTNQATDSKRLWHLKEFKEAQISNNPSAIISKQALRLTILWSIQILISPIHQKIAGLTLRTMSNKQMYLGINKSIIWPNQVVVSTLWLQTLLTVKIKWQTALISLVAHKKNYGIQTTLFATKSIILLTQF